MAKRTDIRGALQRMFIPGDMSPLFEEIGEIIQSSWKRNFEEGGRFGSDNRFGGGNEKWIPSRRALGLVKSRHTNRKGIGKTLVDSEYLSGSISYRVTKTGVIVGTKATYGWKHHEGEGGMVKRPWAVIQDEDLIDIHDAVISFYSRVLRRK